MGLLSTSVTLAKPRIMVMVVVTVLLGAAAVPDPRPTGPLFDRAPAAEVIPASAGGDPAGSDPARDVTDVVVRSLDQGARTLLWAVGLTVGSLLVAGSAGATNSLIERRRDALMERTRRRPLPSGRITPFAAGVVAAGMLGVGTAILVAATGGLPAAVAGATWLAYIVLYTPLKPLTTWNTTVGAVSGALPIGIGWTAADGPWTGVASLPGWACLAGLFLWQYPHFMAIAWRCRDDYAAAGFRMESTVRPDGRSAGVWAVAGVAAMVGVGLILTALGLVGFVDDVTAARSYVDDALVEGSPPTWTALRPWGTCLIVMGLGLVAASVPLMRAAIRFARQRTDETAKSLMKTSLLTLPAYLAWIVLAVRVLGP